METILIVASCLVLKMTNYKKLSKPKIFSVSQLVNHLMLQMGSRLFTANFLATFVSYHSVAMPPLLHELDWRREESRKFALVTFGMRKELTSVPKPGNSSCRHANTGFDLLQGNAFDIAFLDIFDGQQIAQTSTLQTFS